MDSGLANRLFKKFAGAAAYVAIERSDGSHNIGSAFHVGEGVFVTARHVVEGVRIRRVATTESTYVYLTGKEAKRSRVFVMEGRNKLPVYIVQPKVFELEAGPFFDPHDDVDVAVFRVKDADPRMPWVPLGSHLDDWLGQSDFVLSEVIILGYPPIPMTGNPYLVAARAEVNAQIDLRSARHVHFILSAMPRGGFSGGLAVSEAGFALGVITSSLLTDDNQAELGFFNVLSVEPIYNCLASHKLLPEAQAKGWDDFWNIEYEYFEKANNSSSPVEGARIAASVGIFDDGKRLYIELSCDGNSTLLSSIVSQVKEKLSSITNRRQQVRRGLVRIHIKTPTAEARLKLEEARQAACSKLIQAGYSSNSAKPDPA